MIQAEIWVWPADLDPAAQVPPDGVYLVLIVSPPEQCEDRAYIAAVVYPDEPSANLSCLAAGSIFPGTVYALTAHVRAGDRPRWALTREGRATLPLPLRALVVAELPRIQRAVKRAINQSPLCHRSA